MPQRCCRCHVNGKSDSPHRSWKLKVKRILCFLIHYWWDCKIVGEKKKSPMVENLMVSNKITGFPGGASGKEIAYQCRRNMRCQFYSKVRKIPWMKTWQPLQYSCLENPMDRETWQAAVCRVTKSWMLLKQLSTHTQQNYICPLTKENHF